MNRGLFIMIEGTDGSGKGTQTELLVQRFQTEGLPVEQIHFPQYGERSAAVVEDYLNGKFGTADEVGPYRASIFYAVDRYAASPKIQTWLNQGKIVIANRYVGSNLGHQGGKIADSEQRKKYFQWNYDLEYGIFQIPKPDVNIILHVKPEISQQLVDQKSERAYLNGKKRDIHEDDLSHLKNAESAYLQLANIYAEFQIIECVENETMLNKETIHEKIWLAVKKHLEK